MLQAEVLQAEVLQAEVLQAEVLQGAGVAFTHLLYAHSQTRAVVFAATLTQRF